MNLWNLVLTRFRLGLLHVNFHRFTTELWSLIIIRISFPLNILRTNRWSLIKFCIGIDLNWISVGMAQFSWVMALRYCQKAQIQPYTHHKPLITFWFLITKTLLFKYFENFTTKIGKFFDKKFWYFSYSCSKHWLWVLVRTASARRF